MNGFNLSSDGFQPLYNKMHGRDAVPTMPFVTFVPLCEIIL